MEEATATATLTPSGGVCAGDCDDSGGVAIDELITIVNIALDDLPVSACTAGDTNGDGEITIDEIIAAVKNALSDCGMV